MTIPEPSARVDVWIETTSGLRRHIGTIPLDESITNAWLASHLSQPSKVLSWYWKPDVRAWIIRVRKGTI